MATQRRNNAAAQSDQPCANAGARGPVAMRYASDLGFVARLVPMNGTHTPKTNPHEARDCTKPSRLAGTFTMGGEGLEPPTSCV